jgi:deoxyribodipyrimidine photolyase
MTDKVTLYFDDEHLRKGIQKYADKRNISFSRATLELAATGLAFFIQTGSISPYYIFEKWNRMEENLKKSEAEKSKLMGVVDKFAEGFGDVLKAELGKMMDDRERLRKGTVSWAKFKKD